MRVYDKPCFIKLCNDDIVDRLISIGQTPWREPYERADAICASMPLPYSRDAHENNSNYLKIRLDVCEQVMRTNGYIDCGIDIELFIKTASSCVETCHEKDSEPDKQMSYIERYM